MSSFICSREYIPESVPDCRSSARAGALLKIQEYVNRALGGVFLQKVADGFIVHRQFAEDLLGVALQFLENFLEFCLVEDICGGDWPGGVELAFSSERKPREHHLAEVILKPFLNTHDIGDRVSLIIIGCHWVGFRFEVAVMTILFADAVPSLFDLHTIGDAIWFCAQQSIQREFRYHGAKPDSV